MKTALIHSSVIIHADINEVFNRLVDHGSYSDFPHVEECSLLREGEKDKNGVGALRRVRVDDGLVLDEEIPAYEPPHLFQYRVVGCEFDRFGMKFPFPLNHLIGQVTCVQRGDAVEVNWVSKIYFRKGSLVTLPLTKVLALVFRIKFDNVLAFVKKELEAEASAQKSVASAAA